MDLGEIRAGKFYPVSSGVIGCERHLDISLPWSIPETTKLSDTNNTWNLLCGCDWSKDLSTGNRFFFFGPKFSHVYTSRRFRIFVNYRPNYAGNK